MNADPKALRELADTDFNVRNVGTWPKKLRDFAFEAIENERLHASRADRLCEAGLAVMIRDRCVVKIPARDALHDWWRREKESKGVLSP